MSPTRRDVLKSVAAVPVALALPTHAEATPHETEAEIEALLRQRAEWSRHALDDLMARIETERQETTARLARLAIAHGIELEEETPTRFVAWQQDRPGECELVTLRTSSVECTCRRYRVWHRCEHAALVASLHGRMA